MTEVSGPVPAVSAHAADFVWRALSSIRYPEAYRRVYPQVTGVLA